MPYAPEDFEAQALELDRQQKLAAALRKQAMDSQTPEGKMVSGYYIAPNKYAAIPGILNSFMATQAESKAAEAMKAYKQKASEAATEWESRLPQAVAAIPGTPGRAALPGPRAEGGSPELEAIAPTPGTPAQPLTSGQILKYTLSGRRIPGNEKAAEIAGTMLGKELEREDTQQARKDAAEAAAAIAREKQKSDIQARLDSLKLQLEDRGLDRANRADIAAQHNALLKYLGELNNQTKLSAIEAKSAADKEKDKNKPVNTTVMKDLNSLQNQAVGVGNMAASFKPEYGGVGGAINKVSGTYNPLSGKASEDAANWWKDYESQAALVERHEKFGTALSAGEQAAWKNATIAPGMKPSVIEHNLKVRARLADELYNRTRSSYIKGGHTGVENAFEERLTPGGTATGGAPTKVNSVEEAMKLPSGTVFIDPNGVQRVR